MVHQQVLTLYNFFVNQDKSISCYKHKIRNGLVDEHRRTSFIKNGQKVAHKAYISIKNVDNYVDERGWGQAEDADKAIYYTVKDDGFDFIVVGDCGVVIDTTSTATIQASIADINKDYKTYKIGAYDTKFHGSPYMWHIEVGIS